MMSPIKWVPDQFPQCRGSGPDVDHPPPSSAEVKNEDNIIRRQSTESVAAVSKENPSTEQSVYITALEKC